MRHGGGDACPMGLGICWGGTQGGPACRSPTLGLGTQSRWDWGAGELMGAGSLGQRQGRDGLVTGVRSV